MLILFISLFVILTVKTLVMYLRLMKENNLPINFNFNLIVGSIYIGFRFSLIFILGFARCILFSIIALLTLIAGDEEVGQYSFKHLKKDWKGYIYFVINSLKE